MSDAYTIRLGTPADAQILSAIAARTFHALATTALKDDMAPEDIAVQFATAYTVDKMQKELEDPNGVTIFLFPKEDAANPCAFAILHDCSVRESDKDTGRAEEYLEIKRFYVDTAFHGKGAAHLMMGRVIEIVRQKNRKIVWLGTALNNIHAQKFYQKYGFEITAPYTFQVGSVVQKGVELTKKTEL